MSKSLALVGGDLAIGAGSSFQTVSGKTKLAQDLKLWILERIGTDPAIPTYGSTLDGGTVDGLNIPSFIGDLITESVLTNIRSEIIKLVQQYQSMQYDKMRAETLAYLGRTTLDESEVVQRILSVSAKAVGTTVLAQAVIKTLDGTEFKLTIPLGAISA